MSVNTRSGGRVLVDQLIQHGVERAFCVPGESYLDVLNALHDSGNSIALINARHEAGAANMAEAYGKLTGRPGICFVTRGPGACHAAVGVHTAFQDSTPMILFVGQVDRSSLDREAFQELDYRQLFGGVAKWSAQIDRAERIPEYVARAFRVATSGRPGPVVLALPEDMLFDQVSVADAPPYEVTQPQASPHLFQAIRPLLAASKRPLVLVGGSGWTDAASADMAAFLAGNGLPVCSSFRRQDAIENGFDNYAGDLGTSGPPKLIKRMKEADFLLIVGSRLGEMTSQGYEVVQPTNATQIVVHVHVDPDEIGRVYSPHLGIASSVPAAARALAALEPVASEAWSDWLRQARADYLESRSPPPCSGALDLGTVFALLDTHLGDEAIITLDAGNHTGWPQRFLAYGRGRRQLGSTNGAMGYAVPAAVSAALERPDACVVACVGDGGFQMSGLELAAATQHGGCPIILVFNNGTYGTIRMHQERHFPERVVGTELINPDFVLLGQAMVAHAERVTRTEEFLPAFERARRSGRPALIELLSDKEQISSRTTITALRGVARG